MMGMGNRAERRQRRSSETQEYRCSGCDQVVTTGRVKSPPSDDRLKLLLTRHMEETGCRGTKGPPTPVVQPDSVTPCEHREFLPDSRARETRGIVRAPGGNRIPVYCANCGTPWGTVPEKDITFLFALCEKCAETYGPIAHTYVEPDSVFWERIGNAQQEVYHKTLTPAELAKELEDPSSTMSKLAREWQSHAANGGRK